MVLPAPILAGVALAVAGAWWLWRRDYLTGPGGVSAGCLGVVLVAAGGLVWGVVFAVAFAATAALSARRHRPRAGGSGSGGEIRRSAVQVLGSGGGPVVVALLHAAAFDRAIATPAFAGALATAIGDTWSSDLAGSAGSDVRLVTTGERVPPGTPGGVSGRGLGLVVLAGLSVAALLAVGARLRPGSRSAGFDAPGLLTGAAVVGALVGTTVDSLLRATTTEWMASEVVNFVSALVGAAAATALALAAR